VTVLNTELQGGGAVQAAEVPQRGYWGSCGVQRPEQGDRAGVTERRFAVERAVDGTPLLRLGDRRIGLPLVNDLRCASASADGDRLAVVDASGLRLFDLGGENEQAAPAQLVHILDPTIRTVSFVGDRQQMLLTAHAHKVTIWRPGAPGEYLAETVYSNTRPVLFAEGSPVAQRMLVWLGKATAEAGVEVVPIPYAGRAWFSEDLLWLVNQPDIFFGTDGELYRLDQGKAYRLMSGAHLPGLVAAAEEALSPNCVPAEPGVYASSRCWPTNR
jgi:hypothetical protein